jgi:hypothetical protein
MAKRKLASGRKSVPKKKRSRTKNSDHGSKPKFPYTVTASALRIFLKQIPERPKPGKVNLQTLRSWGIRDSNAYSILRVLKSVELLSGNNEPTKTYEEFMKKNTGPAVLGEKIRSVYKELFEASNEPYKENADSLKNLFNIHSGGSAKTIQFQIQTFKALCEHAAFTAIPPATRLEGAQGGSAGGSTRTDSSPANIHIDLHVHLPENKTRRDYEYMFEDIAKYIYGKGGGGSSANE